LKIRAKAAIEKIGKEREAIIVTEIPYQVNKARLVEQASALVNEKKIEGISDIRDESDREGMRIVFELKRGEQAEVILNNLYKHTQMQVNFGVIMLAIVNGQPKELGLIDAIKRFIDHRIDVVRRRTDYLLRKAREREHILLGFQKALNYLDAVIALIRAARNPKEAREGLQGLEFSEAQMARIREDYPDIENLKLDPARKKELQAAGKLPALEGLAVIFDFTERQAQAIIELQLQRLTGMEQQKILDELAEIQKQIAEYQEILSSDTKLRGVIRGADI
jgi:DNA gyrase subunit A